MLVSIHTSLDRKYDSDAPLGLSWAGLVNVEESAVDRRGRMFRVR
jgi:hypothetical protein